MRESMTSFNEARFKAECAVIDSVVRADGRSFEVLPGGVIVQRAKDAGGDELAGWRPDAGNWVRWDWQAFTLDGVPLTKGQDEFELERGAVPRAFHEAARRLGHGEEADVWSPSLSAFGVRGVPGEVPPFSPVKIHVTQTRSGQDTAWLSEVQRGAWPESDWLVTHLLGAEAESLMPGVMVHVHRDATQAAKHGDLVRLRIQTSVLDGGMSRETQLEWVVGTQDQLVMALERALLAYPRAEQMTVWSTSTQAFGEEGSLAAGIPGKTPIRFDVEVIRG